MNLPTLYQEVIHKTKYARWLDNEQRRETWPETVKRYMDFMEKQVAHNNYELPQNIRTQLESAILNLEIMPSMRALMTAGPALERDNVAGYNCAYLAVDSLHAFDETMYILMNGTGVGFSVERQHVNKLPEVAEEFHPTETTITVRDSKLGWASALKELIALLYGGQVPKWDLSRIRPAGARLKTFGGRASGPDPLDRLFQFAVTMFRNAAGRKLNSLECHDLICKIAEVVVVGGVRRSACISLSNLTDQRMRKAKSGQWWETNPQRALANNSVCYSEKPDIGIFMKEWLSLYYSKSGERGIFNLEAAQNKANENGRRDGSQISGSNPCVPIDTWVMTPKGPKQVSQLLNKFTEITVNGESYPSFEGFYKTGNKQVYEIETKKGHKIQVTSNHPLLLEKQKQREWVKVADLKVDDKLTLSSHVGMKWKGIGTFKEGWLLGELVGDGGFVKTEGLIKKGYTRFWGDSQGELAKQALKYMSKACNFRSDVTVVKNKSNKTFQVGCLDLARLATKRGITSEKELTPILEQTSSDFYCGFIQGFFDADGSIQGNQRKGVSIRLGQSDLKRLECIQRMLLRLGINSTIYKNRRKEGYYKLPDGKGNLKDYWTKAAHELVIAKSNIKVFAELINFTEPAKRKRLNKTLSSYNRALNKEKFTDVITKITPLDKVAVYDITVEGAHEFCANGIRAHNCNEILLRNKQFCNLSEVMIRAEDTEEDLLRKVRLATILGTMQSTLTDFRYLTRAWLSNTEEERLLGVSLTGIVDSKLTNGKNKDLPELLEKLRTKAVVTNKTWAKRLGVNQATAVTCGKPSGTVSQLTDTASGIHARYSPYYIRRIRADKKDPIMEVIKEAGVPYEDDAMQPHSTGIFSFPIKSPKGSITRDDLTALQQLEFWLTYQRHWCEHKPSCTIYVKEDEWLEVGAWVWEHFDEVCGISFLPHTDHIYQQAPYTEMDYHEYNRALKEMPKSIDWGQLNEDDDNTEGSQELACGNGSCDIQSL